MYGRFTPNKKQIVDFCFNDFHGDIRISKWDPFDGIRHGVSWEIGDLDRKFIYNADGGNFDSQGFHGKAFVLFFRGGVMGALRWWWWMIDDWDLHHLM